MEDPETWRELLGSIIKDPQEKQRIADELNINPITLIRWVNGSTKPRVHHVHQLLKTLPQYRQELVTLIAEEFEDIFDLSERSQDEELQEIPAEFYARILTAHATTPYPLHASLLYTLILQQALGHLDPKEQGLSITVVRCTHPPAGKKVRTLREDLGRGTSPWKSHLENQTILLGAESLAGYAVSSFRFVTNQNIRMGPSFLPVRRTRWEESAAACPLLQGSRIAGCLLVASTRPNYFSPARLSIIQNYANLLILACEQEEFYESSNIQLWMMPPPHVQESYFIHFQQRVTDRMLKSVRENQPLSRPQAEREVWNQLEEELLQTNLLLPADSEEYEEYHYR